MKNIHTIVTIFAFAILPSIVRAETQYERELKQLKEQRDRAIATAVELLNRRYKDSLDLLLRRATQGNDLDTALKIKTELGSATSAPAAQAPVTPLPQPNNPAPAGAALTDLKLQLPGSKWKQFAYNLNVEFHPDGTLKQGAQSGKYEVKTRDKVAITIENGKPAIFNLSRDGRQLEIQKGVPKYILQSPN